MKFFTATKFASTVLIFESLSILSQASPIEPLYSETAYASQLLCESIEDQNDCVSTDLYDPIQSCYWDSINAKCVLAEEEDICEHITDSEDACNQSFGCAWVNPESYDRSGEGHCLAYRIVSEGSCTYNYEDRLYILNSKDKCNDIKGCFWTKVQGGKKSCQVAPSQLVCEDIENKKECKKSGCGWKKKACGGRWEQKFLNYLVGKKLEPAKAAIQVEYGETYSVHVEAPKMHVSERITLVVNKEGVIVKAPLFG
eukprot:CAMPEP_0168207060 /NCGR_PEP_ID=MMETSP0140_2-20121125/1294_1 /TAXON_ID=44445 /ORGANISM="Pseudo-nitzschia australis, Strain 10249 10 AB" /LENGTH=254 /DNA_ID=CAMNT_0008133287 /DNA_START=138 /DNA_END=902 /DNA_ORIENTATION=+